MRRRRRRVSSLTNSKEGGRGGEREGGREGGTFRVAAQFEDPDDSHVSDDAKNVQILAFDGVLGMKWREGGREGNMFLTREGEVCSR